MPTEKLQILKMLENGQITADEASRLLQAVDGGGAPTPSPVPAPPTPVAPLPPSGIGTGASIDSAYSAPGNNGPAPRGGAHTSGSTGPGVMEDLGRKFESFARDMAPKMQKFAESAVGAIAGATDKISDVLTAPPAPRSPGPGPGSAPMPSATTQSYRPPAPRPVAAATGGATVVNIEQYVEAGGYNELSIAGLNGEVRIKGYNGDKITATLTYRAKRPGTPIELTKLGAKYFLNYEADDFSQVSIDAYVPERAFGILKVSGINCALDCSSLGTTDMHVINANGTLSLSGISATTLFAENGNGRFVISNIAAENATLENMNGSIECSEIDIANLKLTNYNSPVSIIMSGFNRHRDYLWSVETGNAKLSMNLPTIPTLGYHIKAHAAMGEIRLGLTGMQFLINEPSLVEARSVSFDHTEKKLKLAAETSNAPLTIS